MVEILVWLQIGCQLQVSFSFSLPSLPLNLCFLHLLLSLLYRSILHRSKYLLHTFVIDKHPFLLSLFFSLSSPLCRHFLFRISHLHQRVCISSHSSSINDLFSSHFISSAGGLVLSILFESHPQHPLLHKAVCFNRSRHALFTILSSLFSLNSKAVW